MNQPSALIWTLVACVGLMLFALFLTAYKLRTVSSELRDLTKSLDRLDARLSEQERRLAEVRSSLSEQGDDAFAPFVAVFQRLKSKGWLAAMSLIGSHLFRSYLGRRRSALPSKRDS